LNDLRERRGELLRLDVNTAALFHEKALGNELEVWGDLAPAGHRNKLLKANSSILELS